MTKRTKNNRRKHIRAAKRKQRTRNIIVICLLIIASGAYLLWNRLTVPGVTQIRLEDNPVFGPREALVTLTEFGDFTCSACKAWHNAGIMYDIVAQYEGNVRLEWRDLPIITADSPKAAQAGQCAHDQDRFWDFLDRVYAEPGSSYTNAGAKDLVRYAEDIGLNMEMFNSCLDTNQHLATVDYDLQFARGLGMNGTPSFMVNDIRILGGDPSQIIQTIEAELSRLQ